MFEVKYYHIYKLHHTFSFFVTKYIEYFLTEKFVFVDDPYIRERGVGLNTSSFLLNLKHVFSRYVLNEQQMYVICKKKRNIVITYVPLNKIDTSTIGSCTVMHNII